MQESSDEELNGEGEERKGKAGRREISAPAAGPQFFYVGDAPEDKALRALEAESPAAKQRAGFKVLSGKIRCSKIRFRLAKMIKL